MVFFNLQYFDYLFVHYSKDNRFVLIMNNTLCSDYRFRMWGGCSGGAEGGGVSCKHVPRDCELPTYLIVVGLADKRFPLLLRSAPLPLTGLISQTYRKNICNSRIYIIDVLLL